MEQFIKYTPKHTLCHVSCGHFDFFHFQNIVDQGIPSGCSVMDLDSEPKNRLASVNKTCLYYKTRQYNLLIPGSVSVDADSFYAFGINIARSLLQISKNGTIISISLSRTHARTTHLCHFLKHTHTHSLIKQNQHLCPRLSFFRNFPISFTATL